MKVKKSTLNKAITEVLLELSPETRKQALDKMRSKGQTDRADKWEKHHALKDLKKFEGKPYNDEFTVQSFSLENGNIVIHLGSRNSSSNAIYDVKKDTYVQTPGPDGKITRKTARLLSLIAKEVNPDTQYKNGTGDFKIQGY